MGLDLLDVSFRIEKEIGVQVEADDWTSLIRHNDIEVGDLYLLVLRRLHLHDVARTSLALNRHVWETIQAALSAATMVPAEWIELATPLGSLFPVGTRQEDWEAFRARCRWAVGELEYPANVVSMSWTLAITAAVIEQWQFWKWGRPPGSLWLLLGLVGLWMVVETRRKIMRCLRRWRTGLPRGLTSVKDLCRATLANNLRQLADEDDAPVTIDAKAAYIWQNLRQVLADALGVDESQVTFRSRLMRDLGLS